MKLTFRIVVTTEPTEGGPMVKYSTHNHGGGGGHWDFHSPGNGFPSPGFEANCIGIVCVK